VRENTRREYRRLLVSFALTYFDRDVRVRDLDRAPVQQFVDWLTTQPGHDGRLRDRSIANAITRIGRLTDLFARVRQAPSPASSPCWAANRLAIARLDVPVLA
jgi:hypothetical protein